MEIKTDFFKIEHVKKISEITGQKPGIIIALVNKILETKGLNPALTQYIWGSHYSEKDCNVIFETHDVKLYDVILSVVSLDENMKKNFSIFLNSVTDGSGPKKFLEEINKISIFLENIAKTKGTGNKVADVFAKGHEILKQQYPNLSDTDISFYTWLTYIKPAEQLGMVPFVPDTLNKIKIQKVIESRGLNNQAEMISLAFSYGLFLERNRDSSEIINEASNHSNPVFKAIESGLTLIEYYKKSDNIVDIGLTDGKFVVS